MSNRKLTFILISFCLLIFLAINVNAGFPYSPETNRTGNETFDSDAVMLINHSFAKTSQGMVSFTGDGTHGGSVYVHRLNDPTSSAHCVYFDFRIRNESASCYIFGASGSSNASVGVTLREASAVGGQFRLQEQQAGALATADAAGVVSDGTWHEARFCAGTDGMVNLTINGTATTNVAWDTTFNFQTFGWGRGADTAGTAMCGFDADNWVAVNGTNYTEVPAVAIDTTPPAITLLNLTSEGGLGQIVFEDGVSNNKQIAPFVKTNDTTPTFFSKTDEASTCKIIDRNHDYNYSNSSAVSDCSTTGNLIHICTLAEANSTLFICLNNISIGCKDSSNNENRTSTSGKFLVNITSASSPNVSIFKPQDGKFFVIGVNITQPMQFNWSAIDNVDVNISTCKLYVDNALQQTVNLYNNGTKYLSNVTISDTGTFIWNVNCTNSYGNSNRSQRFSFTITEQFNVNVSLQLNGTHANRSYEYATTLLNKDYGVELNINVSPNTTVCIDYDYMINWTCVPGNTTLQFNVTELNNTRFANGNFSVNTSPNNPNVTFKIDNNTDLVRFAFKVLGDDGSAYPNNVTIDFDGDRKEDFIFPGAIKSNELELNEYKNSVGPNRRASNFTFSTPSSTTFLINVSTALKFKNLTMLVSGTDLDINNVFSYTEQFNTTTESKGFNESLSQNTSAAMWVFDSFDANNSKWSLEQNDGCSLNYQTFESEQVLSNGCSSADDYVVYNDKAGDLRNSSRVEIITTWIYSGSSGGSEAIWRIYATDGTSNVQLFTQSDAGAGQNNWEYNFTMTKLSDDYETWFVNNNRTGGTTVDMSSLNFDNKIQIKFQGLPAIGSGGSSNINLKKISWSGAALGYSNNGTYNSQGNITSATVRVTTNNVTQAKLSASYFDTDATDIRYFLSNTCNATNPYFENVINDQTHLFTTTGNRICYRMFMNTSSNFTTPVIKKVTISVVKSSIENISFDFGADGTVDWEYENILNSTTSPKSVNGSTSALTTYVNDNCANVPTCSVPITITSETSGILSIDSLNLTQNILDTVNLSADILVRNLSKLENKNEHNWTVRYKTGRLNFLGLDIEFRGSKNISLYAHSKENSSFLLGTDNLTMRMFYSKHNETYPKGVTSFQSIPLSNNQSNISIFGQQINYCSFTSDDYCVVTSTPIFNATDMAYDDNIDLYVRMNDTYNYTFFNFSIDTGVNRSAATAFQVNGTIYKPVRFNLLTNSTNKIGESLPIFGFVDFMNVNFSNVSSVDIDFDWRTYCNTCVR